MLDENEAENHTLEKDALLVDFFVDFLSFINYIKENTITTTKTGNISRNDISELRKIFRYQEYFKYLDEMNWKIRTETEIDYLHQMRILCEIMYITYRRKGKILLSKNGKGYLDNIPPLVQYWNMVLAFWARVNWEYFSPGNVTKLLQKNQSLIRDIFLKNGENWIDFNGFCQTLKLFLKLEKHYSQEHTASNPDFYLGLDIEYGLFRRNLQRFGCVELEEKKSKYLGNNIVKFKPTKLGLYVFERSITSHY